MRDKLDEFIYLKCGAPKRYDNSMDTCGYGREVSVAPIPISLSHVIESFKNTRIRLNLTDSGVVSYRSLDTASLLSFLCDWIFVKVDGDQAWFHEQTQHTKLAICKLHGYEE